MLVISGTAQYCGEDGQYAKGDLHSFTMFSNDENFEGILDTIESYLNDLGWDDILVTETELIASDSGLEHQILKQAFDKAANEGMAVVVNNSPITSVA
ncbi:hypothetical protein AAD001_03305 [Colwelliaceae bacterium 6471]